MKKIIAAFVITSTLITASCTKEEIDTILKNTPTGLTNEEVIAGLKQALSVGTDSSATKLHKVDGYYLDAAVKIFLPQEAQVIYDNLSKIPGGSSLVEEAVMSINRAAEDAATEAKPIFVSAITSMTITDGLNILNGSDSAATTYLKGRTYDSLFVKFQPKINNSLSKPLTLGYSAEDAYSSLINTYNQASLNGILWDKIEGNSLSEHVTRKGLDGLFLKVAEKEKDIRENPLEQVTDLLKKVFGKK